MADLPPDSDLIVLGAGSAGLGLSLFMARLKLRVLLIDQTAEDVGGDCLNHGCVPSKALLHAARQVHQARQATRFGLQMSGAADMGQVMAYIQERQAIIRQHENPEYLRGLGIVVETGSPRFVGRHAVTLNGRTYRGREIVVATGSRPQLHQQVENRKGGRLHTGAFVRGNGGDKLRPTQQVQPPGAAPSYNLPCRMSQR